MNATHTKTQVVVSAGRGINLAIAHRLAASGHTVLLTDIDADAARTKSPDRSPGA